MIPGLGDQKNYSFFTGHQNTYLRLHDPAYFCENLDLYIFVLFSFILSDGDLSS